ILVENQTRSPAVRIDVQSGSLQFNKEVPLHGDWQVVKADVALTMKDPNVKAVRVQASPDKKKLIVSGEPSKPAASVTVTLVAAEQRKGPPTVKAAEPLASALSVPGSTVLPLPQLPPGWVVKNRKLGLALVQDGKKVEWKENELPNNAVVQISSGHFFGVTATVQGGQVRIDLSEVKSAWHMFGN